MENAIHTLGYTLLGGHITFLIFVVLFLLFAAPRIYVRRNSASRALHQMLAIAMLYQLFTYVLWLIPELVSSQKEVYDVVAGWEMYERVLNYLDVLCLPLTMLLGHVVIYGQFPPVKFFAIPAGTILVAAVVSLFLEDDDTFFYIVSSVFLVLCIMQFTWYIHCVKTYHKKLLDHCSNIDNRQLGWLLQSQFPALLIACLYVPLVAIPDKSVYFVIYDALLMIVHFYIVLAVLIHRVDDDMLEVVSGIDYRAEARGEVQQPVVEASQPAAEATQPAAEAPQPVAEASTVPVEAEPQTAEPAAAPSDPLVWTRTERESYDFSDQMKKLEDEEFYTDPDVNIDWLADHLGTNRHYVSNYLNQILKMNFYEYVNSLRLQHAEHLLRTSNEKASAIGYMSGFNSEGTYRRLFKDRYGCTPTQYIKQAA